MSDTYGDLKAKVANWLDRLDLTSEIPEFIRLAETEIYRDLRCPENQFVATYNNSGWSIDGHPASSDTNGVFLQLPPNFKQMEEVVWSGLPMECVSRQNLDYLRDVGATGEAVVYAINNRTIDFSKALDSDQSTWGDGIELIYTYYGTESLDSLPTWQVGTNPVENPPVEDNSPEDLAQSDSNTTRLLQVAPDLYLHGACYYGALFLKDDRMQQWGVLFQAALAALKRESRMSNFAGSTVAVRNYGGQ